MKIVIYIPDSEVPSRQELISVDLHFIDGHICECTYPFQELEAEPCEDAISREDALMALTGEWTESRDELIAKFIRRIKKLPSVTPAQKIGRWINTGSGQECSECGEIQYGYDNFKYFCAKCGAKMVEPQENEEV